MDYSEFKKYFEHINYEMQYFLLFDQALSPYYYGKEPSNKNEVINSIAIFESFLLHTRNLISFFNLSNGNAFSTDVVLHNCSNFKIESTKKLKIEQKQYLENSFTSLNKRLFHLTNKRNDQNYYHIRQYVELLMPFINEFIDQVLLEDKVLFIETIKIMKEYNNQKLVNFENLDLKKRNTFYILKDNEVAEISENLIPIRNEGFTLSSSYFNDFKF